MTYTMGILSHTLLGIHIHCGQSFTYIVGNLSHTLLHLQLVWVLTVLALQLWQLTHGWERGCWAAVPGTNTGVPWSSPLSTPRSQLQKLLSSKAIPTLSLSNTNTASRLKFSAMRFRTQVREGKKEEEKASNKLLWDQAVRFMIKPLLT